MRRLIAEVKGEVWAGAGWGLWLLASSQGQCYAALGVMSSPLRGRTCGQLCN